MQGTSNDRASRTPAAAVLIRKWACTNWGRSPASRRAMRAPRRRERTSPAPALHDPVTPDSSVSPCCKEPWSQHDVSEVIRERPCLGVHEAACHRRRLGWPEIRKKRNHWPVRKAMAVRRHSAQRTGAFDARARAGAGKSAGSQKPAGLEKPPERQRISIGGRKITSYA
jgi:hypothetical protein